MTYLFFMKMLDDAQCTTEANANAFGIKVKDPLFKEGDWHNPDHRLIKAVFNQHNKFVMVSKSLAESWK